MLPVRTPLLHSTERLAYMPIPRRRRFHPSLLLFPPPLLRIYFLAPSTAKHRVAKDFVCPVCHKGFARKDILKRHQAGHEKQQQAAHEAAMRGDLLDDDDRRSVGSSASKKKKRPVAQQNNDAADESGGPVKIARVGRACCRCSKSKCVLSTLLLLAQSSPFSDLGFDATVKTHASVVEKPASSALSTVRPRVLPAAPVPSRCRCPTSCSTRRRWIRIAARLHRRTPSTSQLSLPLLRTISGVDSSPPPFSKLRCLSTTCRFVTPRLTTPSRPTASFKVNLPQ